MTLRARYYTSIWYYPVLHCTLLHDIVLYFTVQHRFYTGEPVYPFGYGLSYTSFAARLLNPPTANYQLPFLRSLEASPR